MRLGKEQAAGYVEDIESGVTEQAPDPRWPWRRIRCPWPPTRSQPRSRASG